MHWMAIKDAPKGANILLIEVNPDEAIGFPYTGHYSVDDEAWVNIAGYEVRPTHWMPLPELTEEMTDPL